MGITSRVPPICIGFPRLLYFSCAIEFIFQICANKPPKKYKYHDRALFMSSKFVSISGIWLILLHSLQWDRSAIVPLLFQGSLTHKCRGHFLAHVVPFNRLGKWGLVHAIEISHKVPQIGTQPWGLILSSRAFIIRARQLVVYQSLL